MVRRDPVQAGRAAREAVPATEEHHVRLREIHAADSGRVQHRRFCEAEDREIPYAEVGRGWELPDGQLVPLTDEDLERLPLATRHVVQVLGFVAGQDTDPISYSTPYYVGPTGPPGPTGRTRCSSKHSPAPDRSAYARSPSAAGNGLALLRPRHGILILQTLLWQDELRDPGDLTPSTPVTDRELELAEALMRELTGVEVDQLQDEYRHALEQLVEAKVSGGQLGPPPEPGPAVDLMAALEESARAARTRATE